MFRIHKILAMKLALKVTFTVVISITEWFMVEITLFKKTDNI